MHERFKDIGYFELALTLFMMTIVFWPWIRDFWNPHAMTIDKDLKGDDNKWQANELRVRDSMRIGRLFTVLFIYLLVTTSLFTKNYEWYIWMMCFCGTLGFSGISAYLMKLGFKHTEDDKH